MRTHQCSGAVSGSQNAGVLTLSHISLPDSVLLPLYQDEETGQRKLTTGEESQAGPQVHTLSASSVHAVLWPTVGDGISSPL